jgi:hypothetical protein
LVVSATSSISGQAGQIADQIGESGAQQRFAARDAQLAHAELQEQAREAQHFVEIEPLGGFQEAYCSWKRSRGMQ